MLNPGPWPGFCASGASGYVRARRGRTWCAVWQGLQCAVGWQPGINMSTAPVSHPVAPAAVRRQEGDPADTVIVQTTAPDLMLAKRIAHHLVEERRVACAHIGGPVTSMYMWQGKLEGGDEIPLTFKTAADALPALYQRLCELHPYDVPEFLVQGVVAGSAPYLAWVTENTRAGVDPDSSAHCLCKDD